MRILSVQLLRAVAALVVVSGHVMGAAKTMGSFQSPSLPTGMGVDLFFVISGFIMVYASDRLFTRPGAGKEFLIKRMLRVVPLYWLSTTAILALTLMSSRHSQARPGGGYLLASYLFIPDASYGSVDGIPFPLLSLGWTLNYEMLFYTVFSLFIFAPRRRAVLGVQVTLVAAVAFGLVVQPASTVLSTWTQPIILEFALGLLIANALLQGLRLSRAASWTLLALAGLWIALDVGGILVLKQTPNDLRRVIGWGVPAACILASVVLGPLALPPWSEKVAALLGDASYSLYLTHPFVIIAMKRAWLVTFGTDHLLAWVVLVLLLTVAFSVAVNKLVERPLTLALNRRLRGTQ
jgi:peptidoglycan/LPS O-acetylase OafA/YrhL